MDKRRSGFWIFEMRDRNSLDYQQDLVVVTSTYVLFRTNCTSVLVCSMVRYPTYEYNQCYHDLKKFTTKENDASTLVLSLSGSLWQLSSQEQTKIIRRTNT